jgi:hypothetical protein
LLKDVWKCAKYWNPKAQASEISAFAWSTWQGADGFSPNAYLAVYDAIQESGLKPIDNEQYFGYVGGRWYTIIVLLQRQGMKRPKHGWRSWIRKHPFEVNKILVHQLVVLITNYGEEDGLRIWQHGGDWVNNKAIKKETDIYIRNIKEIKNQIQQDRINAEKK